MLLEARPTDCFSSKHLLKLDGRPIGRFRGRWLSDGIEIEFVERLRLRFENTSWIGSGYRLIETNSGEVLATAQRAGILSGTWNLKLRSGSKEMFRTHLFSSGFEVRQGAQSVAQVTRIGWLERGWRVEDNGTLDVIDLVFVGLIYHKVLQRQSSG